jgi:predicted TIM-barrel fold metal-dependent hydrolase
MTGRLTFVDAHHHFQDIEAHYYPWLCDTETPPKLEGDLTLIRRNYLLADYLADMHSVNLVKSVHVQNGWDPSDPVGETRWLQGLADRDGFPHAIVAYADLAAPDVQQVLEAHHAFRNVRGIRQILNWHTDPRFLVASRAGLMDDADWRRGYALLRRYELSFDLQIYWPQMAEAFRLAKDYPDTLIILNHFGMPVDRSADGVRSWAAALAHLAQAPNVMIKLSGIGLGHPGWSIEDTTPLLQRTIEIFGMDRVMFGSNLPVDRLFSGVEQIFRAYETMLNGQSHREQVALLRTNAEKAYRI